MECHQMDNLIKSYTEGSLSDERTHIVESHLNSCPNCKAMAKKQQKSRIAAMISIVVALLCVSSLLIFGLMAMRGSFSRTGERIVISNIIIEIFSKDPTGDLTIVRDISKRYDGMIVGEDPLSIRLKKGRVNSFISSMDKILVFPRGTSEKVEDFVGPLMENDEVIVKVKFISENN